MKEFTVLHNDGKWSTMQADTLQQAVERAAHPNHANVRVIESDKLITFDLRLQAIARPNYSEHHG